MWFPMMPVASMAWLPGMAWGVDACRHLPRPYRHLALVVVKDFREDKLAFKPQTLQGIVALQVAWVGKDHVKHHKCRTVLGKQGGA